VNAAAVPGLADLESGIAQDIDHGLIVVQDFRFKAHEALRRGNPGQAFEKQGADATALEIVMDQKSDFGPAVSSDRDIISDPDDAGFRTLSQDRQQGQPIPRLTGAHRLDDAPRNRGHGGP